VLAALGYVTPDGLGPVPLGGADIGLHLFLGLALLLSGMVTTRRRDRGVSRPPAVAQASARASRPARAKASPPTTATVANENHWMA
jgi:hypothetical protein